MSAVTGNETGPAVAGAGTKLPLAVPRRLLRMRSDAALAERFAAGDEAAFDVIYERHRPVVLAVCMGVLGTPPDAEDATQETFSALAVALRTRPPAELRPWLIRVARNASIDTTRRRRHRLLTLDGEIPEIPAHPHGSGQAELAVVLDGIRELPEGQRMALLMRELGGHSYSEIAEFLSTDEEAVKGLIARARVGLRAYREATELSCAAARNTIAAEPDGRRYDKTIRRHLRGCAGCRSYRNALRDDARALRAALPIQAGTVATGSLSGGMVSAAKGSLIGYGLTQAATTCAASACAVGAIGGMVFVAPVHRLGLPPILPSPPVVHRHTAVRVPAKHAVVHVSHTAVVTVSHPESASYAPAETPAKPAVTRRAVADHPRRHVTWVPPHRHHRAGTRAADHNAGVPAHPARSTTAGSSTAGSSTPSTSAPSTSTPSTSTAGASTAGASTAGMSTASASTAGSDTTVNTDQNSQGDQAAQAASAAQSSQATAATGAQSGEQGNQGDGSQGPGSPGNGRGNGHGRGWGSGGHDGNPWRTTVGAGATSAAAGASTPDTAAATTTPTVTTTTTTTTADATTTADTTTTASPTTTSPATTTATVSTSTATTPQVAAQPGNGWGHGRGGTHHGGSPYQGTVQTGSGTQATSSTIPSTTTSTSTTVATSSSSSGDPWGGSHGGGHGHGGWGQQSSGWGS